MPKEAFLAEMVFRAEAGSASSRHDSEAAALAGRMLSMPRRCEALGVEECGSVGAVEIDVGRLSAYADLAVTPPANSAVASLLASSSLQSGGRRSGGSASSAPNPNGGGIADSVKFTDPALCIMAAARAVDKLEIESESTAEQGDSWTLDEVKTERPQEDEDIVF